MAALFQFRKTHKAMRQAQAVAGSVFALSLTVLGASAQPPAQPSAVATIHVSVTLVPVVQTPVPVSPSRSSGTITYSIEAPSPAETYELRNLPPQQQHTKAKRPAVLRTLVIVAR